jgi:GNAT superfamily N-acetyltransferase
VPAAAHLAQVNVARLLAPLDDPMLAGFVDALEPVNALADAAPGFVWRLQTDEGDATALRAFPDPEIIVNLSVWSDLASLRAFAYGSGHVEVFRQRRQWFEPMDEASLAIWWTPAGHVPNVDEAKDRLTFLRRCGPSPWAFNFARPEPPLLAERTELTDPDVVDLVTELNAELMDGDPGGTHFFGLSAADVAPGNGALVVLRLDGDAVGCGAVRRIGPGEAELKRMYVRPAARGRKLGAVLVEVLEAEARSLGARRLLLETGRYLKAALRVYERAGFEPIEAYGEYIGSPDSYCLAKPLEELRGK